MPVTIPLGVRTRVSIGRSPEIGWYAVRLKRQERSGWEGWGPRWDDEGPPDGGVREPRRPPPSPLQGTAMLPEPD